MTTLVYDGKTLATDSQATQGDIAMISPYRKIHLPAEGEYWEIMGVKVLVMALAGDPDMVPWAIDELVKGVTHKTDFSNSEINFLAILVDETGLGWLWGCTRLRQRGLDNYIMSPITGVVSAGSGQVLANALLSVGKKAPEVIELVSKLDVYTGGDVQTWEFPGKPKVPSKRPAPVVPLALTTEQLQHVVEAVQKKDRENNPPLTDEQRAEFIVNTTHKVIGELVEAGGIPPKKAAKPQKA